MLSRLLFLSQEFVLSLYYFVDFTNCSMQFCNPLPLINRFWTDSGFFFCNYGSLATSFQCGIQCLIFDSFKLFGWLLKLNWIVSLSFYFNYVGNHIWSDVIVNYDSINLKWKRELFLHCFLLPSFKIITRHHIYVMKSI